ncbi:MAG: hypothetical protein AAFZ07_12310 [Actinomycetota bacterium]
MSEERETCFVITPIGEPGDDRRLRADALYDGILRPVVEEQFGLTLQRGDLLHEVGNINHQVVRGIFGARVVVADLIEENGNVYYELGIADAFERPVIRFGDPATSRIPFDNAQERLILLPDPYPGVISVVDAERCKQDLEAHLTTVLTEGYEPSTIVTTAGVSAQLQTIVEGGEEDAAIAEALLDIKRELLDTNRRLELLTQQVRSSPSPTLSSKGSIAAPGQTDHTVSALVDQVVEMAIGGMLTPDQLIDRVQALLAGRHPDVKRAAFRSAARTLRSTNLAADPEIMAEIDGRLAELMAELTF